MNHDHHDAISNGLFTYFDSCWRVYQLLSSDEFSSVPSLVPMPKPQNHLPAARSIMP
eukprot:m.293225 g.293225  ORF g.293225 m.293225 type:complete len:57 (-) comp19481_c0_seq1:188-358(-)